MSNPRGRTRLLIQQYRDPGRNFHMYISENPARISVDGIAGLTGDAAVSLLDFFVITEIRPDEDPTYGFREKREIQLRIAIPTVQLLEGLANLLTTIHSELDTMVTAGQENAQAIIRQVGRLRAFNVQTQEGAAASPVGP